MKNEKCFLITRITSGSEVDEIKVEIWCEKKSCVRSEYYAAYAVGLRPKFVLEISSLDYEKCSILAGEERIYPTKVSYQGATFEIIRTYEPKPREMELTIG